MKNRYLLLLTMMPLANASETGGEKRSFTNDQLNHLNNMGGKGADVGMKTGLATVMYLDNAIERYVESASSTYTHVSPSVKSAAENTIKVGAVGLGSWVGYKVGKPIYNYFRPSLEEQVRRSRLNVQLEENKKRAHELEQERFKREAVNELAKCAYNNSSSAHIDSYGIPRGCSEATFRLVMYHENGFDHMRGIGSRIKQLRGENNSK